MGKRIRKGTRVVAAFSCAAGRDAIRSDALRLYQDIDGDNSYMVILDRLNTRDFDDGDVVVLECVSSKGETRGDSYRRWKIIDAEEENTNLNTS